MLATSARNVPCIALASSVAALNTHVSTVFSTESAAPKRCDSIPSGPLTEISPSPTVTSTFGGNLIGLAPMRDMDRLPYLENRAAMSTLPSPVGRGDGGEGSRSLRLNVFILFLVIAAV